MCGRYTLTVTLDELMVHFYSSLSGSVRHQPRFNISPSQTVLAVINDGVHNRIGPLKWGLIPSWSKDDKTALANARAETLKDKPAFKVPFARKRCLIPADSFFEWKKTEAGKQPMRIMLKSGKLFSMAGLYETWIAPDGQKINSCTIITTTANSLVAGIHHRMPVILSPQDEAVWLNRNIHDPEAALMPLLKPYPAEEMKAYPVPSLVGNARNDVPECIQQLAP
ncbi:SOS response-associated peptidase [Paenibacillus naphthalenovorans]|uniref:Abasic site processing protein n=1 Tax=Paenibacillus naphthalenovorans TaxID=162209 RepID=A0A0U2WFU4_9BACL|nr:SOS response-associated peptidase [Paenibacillus naphthalenovorans]ALS25246.1 SOS response associated peptidase [Paenibacillus naphthalenovorans]GCL73355.1 SOS response-associated peptidase [Paenibacillus naphthalenovorans]